MSEERSKGEFVTRPSDEISQALEKGEIYKKGYEDAKKEFEPKLANWRLVPYSNGDRYCTNCRTIVNFYSQKNYCLYCGAKMIAYETPDGLILRTDETSYTYNGY